MLSINPVKPIKPLITNLAENDTRKICSFIVPNNKAGELYLDMRMPKAGYGYGFITELRNRFNKLLGYEEFAFFENSKTISGLFIRANNEYQRSGYNFGEILRLSSIIEILENKIKNFNITSKSSAIYFHSKYKFKPNFTSFAERDKFLDILANDQSNGFEKYSQKAQNLINQIDKNKEPKSQRDCCKQANSLLGDYLEKVMAEKSQDKHQFNYTLGMTLTDENILNNSEFFNNLFEKHGIDYKV